jgi:DNA ligase-1
MDLLRPLLAAKTTEADLQNFKYPGLVSPKIDGVRALVRNGQVVSRTMKPIPNKFVQQMFGWDELNGLDGELVVGNSTDPNLMQQTMSGVMSVDGIPNASYHVFDLWDCPGDYELRLLNLYAMEQCRSTPGQVVIVPQVLVKSYEELLKMEYEHLSAGYEGAMLRGLKSKYKQGRSTVRDGILLKVKRFKDDSEAIVLDFEPLYRNHNSAELDERGYTKRSSHQDNKVADECLGALVLRDIHDGREFRLGSGFTESQRYSLWADRINLTGCIVKYKSFTATGVKDKPRHPIFLGFRDPRDI